MLRARAMSTMILALMTVLPSCSQGDRPVLYPVHGQVMFKGQPAEGATVMFQREDAPTPTALSYVPTGTVDKEGKFSLETDDVGYGAPVGKYKVLIQWRVKEEVKTEPEVTTKKRDRFKVVKDKPDGPPDRLQGRFMKPENAVIKVEVKPEENTIQPFDVSS